jgi:ureidoglycolate lyase
MTTLRVEALTEDEFLPFGKVLALPGNPADADGQGWQWWGEVSALPNDGRRWAFGYLALEPVPMSIDWAERHLRSPEVVLAASQAIAVYVAPAGSPESSPQLQEFRVFEVPAGSGVVLDPGVWHGAPFTLGGPCPALVLLLEGTGRDDVTVVRFPDTPVVVEHAPSDSQRTSTRVKG